MLGVVEGITEFIPVSSTGHLLITEKFLQWIGTLSPGHWLVQGSAAKDLFNVVIQCGAVLAVLPLFHQRLHQFIFQWQERATQEYLLKIAVAFGITGAGGLLLEKKHFKLPENVLPIALALLIGGVLFLVAERWLAARQAQNRVTWLIVLGVGIGQLIAAVFPGTSRSGSTIIIALLLGLNRIAATEFTFLVGIPTMLAAGGLKIFKALHHTSSAPPEYWAMVALGTMVAGVLSFFAVKWLLRYVQTHTFIAFGWYRIGFGLILLALLLV